MKNKYKINASLILDMSKENKSKYFTTFSN
ncbi:Uncharacterised protein [Sphingobacterium spiritivorum]|nr:Uncharacterised protein [Sphingobacterium spiritivorum]